MAMPDYTTVLLLIDHNSASRSLASAYSDNRPGDNSHDYKIN